jgi:glycosyltransferase involved in cell wall biosynthesis
MQSTPSQPALPISVLIPAFNEEGLIARTIEHVQQSFAQAGHSAFEIVVCDNNSTDRTSQVAQSKGARVVFEPHNQISRARNTAARHSLHDWLIFLDADTVLPANLLRATIDTMNEGAVCGGGTIVAFDQPDIVNGALRVLYIWNRISQIARVAAGSYIFCRREAWSETGGFNEEVYAGEELFFLTKTETMGQSTRPWLPDPHDSGANLREEAAMVQPMAITLSHVRARETRIDEAPRELRALVHTPR